MILQMCVAEREQSYAQCCRRDFERYEIVTNYHSEEVTRKHYILTDFICKYSVYVIINQT